jgi:UDP-2,3-diacylglucosamine hydrolase|tara:strand:- start:349 stop:1056 length:708 start_codon:yes stop_codon:yes gene_type:complete
VNQTLIIADLHLTIVERDKVDLFNKFCTDFAAQAEQLFILGDLFNSWIGDDISLDNYRPIINILKNLTKTTKVFIILGNRDFLLASEFERISGCQIIKDPFLLKHNNKNYLLMHGDSLCSDDIDYQRLKKFLRNSIVQFIFLHLPKKYRLKLTGGLRQKSIEAQKYKAVEIMDVSQSTIDQLMALHPNTDLIHGHTHRLNTHPMKGYTRYVLGDWNNKQGNVIKLDKNLEWLEIN